MNRDARAIVAALGRTAPKSFAEEIGLEPPFGPAALFRLLVMSLLMGARIRASVALKADLELNRHGWTTPRKMADAAWEERTLVLNRAGYARYDESTSRRLGQAAEVVLERYGGDLRRLRDRAERRPEEERRLLKEFSGIGEVSADIFCREVQGDWQELYPFADRKALEAAHELGLAGSAEELARLTSGPQEFARLVSGLVRIGLEKRIDEVRGSAEAA